MQALNRKFITILSCLLLISGCQMLGEKATDKPRVEDLSLDSLANQNKQINQSIHLLEKGNFSEAENIIREVLKYNNSHPTANLLLDQLTLPAAKIFKTQRTANYQIKGGDSLGIIAEKWLGNSLYFVSLARLNNIKKPIALQKNTIIKIPVTTQSELAQKERRRSKANIGLLKQYRSTKDYYKGLNKANRLFIIDTDLEKLLHEQQLTLDALIKSTASLSDRSKMLAKVTELSKQSRNDEQRALYQRFIKTQNRVLFLDEATLLFEDQSYAEAAQKLVNAKKIDDRINKETSVFRMEKLLLNKLHEQAVVLYRNHSLRQALDRWSLILQLDPTNELAKKYTQRTNKLLKKLNQY